MPDHPRACGANRVSHEIPVRFVGSSPRMRGKRCGAESATADPRIIPAHAGQTHRQGNGTCTGTDHPRACGANVCWIDSTDVPIGSSPRMRGKPYRFPLWRLSRRIIPAHAGQTVVALTDCAMGADHPRACGANELANQNADSMTGSSPRMRGKHGFRCR